MKKLWSLLKWSCVGSSIIACALFYMIVASSLFKVFEELQMMQNLTTSMISTRNEMLVHATPKDGIDEVQLQKFYEKMTFLIWPRSAMCDGRPRINSTTNNDSFDDFFGDVNVFVVVKSRPYEFFQRDAIRRTYGEFFRRKLVFAVGRSGVDDVEDSLRLEASVNDDIIQGDFIDSYFNLSYKSLSILKWITDKCDQQHYYVQADSDALLFPENIRLFTQKNKLKRRHIFGLCWRQAKVVRRGKWRVPDDRYSFRRYPEYCSGAAFVMTGDVPQVLLDNLNRSASYMSVDDAYFSGILAEKSGVSRINFPGFRFDEELADGELEKCPCQKLMATFEYKSSDAILNAWTRFRLAQAHCL